MEKIKKMKKTKKKKLVLVVALLVLALLLPPLNVIAAPPGGSPLSFIEKTHDLLDEVPIEHTVESRWWLAEGLNTDETLKKELKMLYEAGWGAVEIVCMGENGAPDELYAWGSEEWAHDIRLIISECTKYGMGFSLTSGTHWGNANLPVEVLKPDDPAASKELDYTIEILAPGQTRSGPLTKLTFVTRNAPQVTASEAIFMSAVAYRVVERGTTTVTAGTYKLVSVDPDKTINLTDQVQNVNGEYVLNWTAPGDGEYELHTYWLRPMERYATPSVSANVTINYVDTYGVEAMIDYWEENFLTADLRELIKQNGRGQLYMDSLEFDPQQSFGNICGYNFFDVFMERRGYDPTPYLAYLAKPTGFIRNAPYYYEAAAGDGTLESKVRYDYYQTLTELYQENVLEPLRQWLHTLGMTLRAEPSYGVTYEISTPAKYLDGVETESYTLNDQLDSYRGMAGGAHIYGKPFSSETGAYSYKPYPGQFPGGPYNNNGNYLWPLDFFTQSIYRQFAGGVGRCVLHGYSSIEGSEADTAWPGHEGMGVGTPERYGPRQPAWGQFSQWVDMIGRFQTILNQGVPRMDLGILRTDYSFNTAPYRMEDPLGEHRGVYWEDMALQDAGFTYDFFSPYNLLESEMTSDGQVIVPDGPAYKALLLYQEYLSIDAAKRILELAKGGIPIIFVNGSHELLKNSEFFKTHSKAAIHTFSLSESDAELAAIVGQIKALPNVREYDDQASAYDGLIELGIHPRAEFGEPNGKIITNIRETDDALYLYAYNLTTIIPYEDTAQGSTETVSLIMETQGRPYNINCWTGEIEALSSYEFKDNKTHFDLTLKPGEATVIALDKTDISKQITVISSDAAHVRSNDGGFTVIAEKSGTYTTVLSNGNTYTNQFTVPADIALPTWNLVVEDWNEGEKMVNEEDRGLGYVTREVYFTTKKSPIEVGETSLIPWKDIPSVGPDVSGVGYYTTTFNLPDGWSVEKNGAYLSIGFTDGSPCNVFVNGVKAPPMDLRNRTVDVSALLQPNDNTIQVVVGSTLKNRLMQRGLVSSNPNPVEPSYGVRSSYGMTGDVKLVTYGFEKLAPIVDIHSDEAVVAVNSPASFTISLSQAKGVGVVTLNFTYDSRFLDLTAVAPLNGFEFAPGGGLTWEYVGGQVWKGTVKLMYPGFVQVDDPLEILKISGATRDILGAAAVSLNDISITGDVNGSSGVKQVIINTDSAKISIVEKAPVYSKYDLNHDGRVNDLDLTIAVYYYLANDLESDWENVKFDIASAKDCDVAVNGIVNLADMIEIIANYSDSYNLFP
ncbi:MAG: hypothetical protein FWH52_00345 [Synergistaceae bacterium]|nr:hypothetical protein [Synergistaceae bacterium]